MRLVVTVKDDGKQLTVVDPCSRGIRGVVVCSNCPKKQGGACGIILLVVDSVDPAAGVRSRLVFLTLIRCWSSRDDELPTNSINKISEINIVQPFGWHMHL